MPKRARASRHAAPESAARASSSVACQARTAASRLFDALRQLDSCGADIIIAEGADPSGIGTAYLNRLRKAAGGGPEPLKETRT